MVCNGASGAKRMLLTVFLLLSSRVQADSEELTKDSMNVLILGLPVMGHLNPVLTVAEELIARGHGAALYLGTQANNSNFRKRVESSGVEYFHFDSDAMLRMEEKFRHSSYLDVFINHLPLFMGEYIEDMILFMNQSDFNTKYNLVLGTEFLTAVLTCVDYYWKIPSLVLGSTTSYWSHTNPEWAWPSILMGASSDDLPFSLRVVSMLEKNISPALFRHFVSPSKKSLDSFCPSLSQDDYSTSIGVRLPYIVPTVMGFEFPRTITSLTDYVGPLISRSPAPVTGELKEWLEQQPDKSVVYVSMGTAVELHGNSGRAILEGVMATKYNLLWSLRKSNQWILNELEIDRERVLISEWTPQFSVLKSEAIHSAILHGGFNGLTEALWNGVPIIALPHRPEQILNVGRLYHNGLGLRLESTSLTKSDVIDALTEIEDGDYRRKIANLQKTFKLAGGVQRAADLVEYYGEVGYDHLIPAYVKYQWTWVQYYNVDVYLVITLACSLFLSLSVSCAMSLTKKCCRKFTSKAKIE